MITFKAVTAKTMDALRQQLTFKNDAVVTGSNAAGTIVGHGVEAHYTWDEAKLILSVDVVKHPFFVTVGAIQKSLGDAIGHAQTLG